MLPWTAPDVTSVLQALATDCGSPARKDGATRWLKKLACRPPRSNYSVTDVPTPAGETADMKFLLNKMRAGFRDSAENSEWGSVYASTDLVPVVNSRQAGKQVVPNVKGMRLKDALYMLEGMKLSVVSKGKGKVVSQVPEAGSAYQKNQQVFIELN